jgi:hypothetical protein
MRRRPATRARRNCRAGRAYFLVLSALGLGRFLGFLSPMTRSFLCARESPKSHASVFSMSSHATDGEQFSDVFLQKRQRSCQEPGERITNA